MMAKLLVYSPSIVLIAYAVARALGAKGEAVLTVTLVLLALALAAHTVIEVDRNAINRERHD